MHHDIVKLATLSVLLKGKTLKLGGETLHIHAADVAGNNSDAHLMLDLTLSKQNECQDTACDCPSCQTRKTITPANCLDVIGLLLNGRSPSLVLDSCSCMDSTFTVKLRHRTTRKCSVGEGANYTSAIARATTLALTP